MSPYTILLLYLNIVLCLLYDDNVKHLTRGGVDVTNMWGSMKKLTAFRPGCHLIKQSVQEEAYACTVRPQGAVLYKIEHIEDATTPSGIAHLVKMKQNADISEPGDVAALVGKIKQSEGLQTKSINIYPDLFFWNDSYYVKGVNTLGVDYYNNKCYVLYKVQIVNPESLSDVFAKFIQTHINV